jgi:hypothetical protein
MSRQLRYIPDEMKIWTDSWGQKIAVSEITIGAQQGRFLLRPSPEVRNIIVSAMAHAQEVHKFDVYAYSFLSNHGSYLIGVTGAEHQAAIMRDIHSKIGLELRRREFSDWTGGIFHRRGRPILVANAEDLIARQKYCLSNSTKEHLVTRPDRWGGAHAAKALCGHGNGIYGRFMEDEGVYNHRSKYGDYRLEGMSDADARKACIEKVTLKLSKLPCWADMGDEAYRQKMVSMCVEISREAAEVRREEGRSVLGMARVLRYHPHHRPDKVARSPAPMIHCQCRDARKHVILGYRLFAILYREALKRLRAAVGPRFFPKGGIPPGFPDPEAIDTVLFPPGGIPPSDGYLADLT